MKENCYVTHRMTLQNCKKYFPCFDRMGYFQVYVITFCAKVGFLGKRNLQLENPMSVISVLPSRGYF